MTTAHFSTIEQIKINGAQAGVEALNKIAPIIVTEGECWTKYVGTREELISYGIAQDHQFPEGRRRVKYLRGETISDGWEMAKLKGGMFEFTKRHNSRTQIGRNRPNPIELNNRLSKIERSATPHLKVEKKFVSNTTIEALEFLLQEAQRGELIGLVYGAMLKGRSCIVDMTGEAERNPLLALGVVTFMSNDIAHRARSNTE